MTEAVISPEAQPSDLAEALERWAGEAPPSLSAALSERGITPEGLEEYVRSGISTEEVETLRRTLVQGAASGNPEDAALLHRLTPLLDPRERAWDRVLRAKSTGEVLSATVTEATKGGVVVDLGVRGFVPASQIGLNVPKNMNQYVGRELRLRVLEVDRRRQTVILSNRSIMEEERAEKRKAAMERIEEGQVRPGTVRRLTDIGAFVDVGGVDGLLHVSEISWKRVDHPSEVLKVGQKVQVKVLRVDPRAGRVSLSMRRLTADPWEEARRKYGIGNIVRVKIGQLVAKGAGVELEEGLDGFLPISELASRRVASAEEVVQPGQEVDAMVIDFRPREHQIVFSLRKLEQKKERREIDTFQRKVTRTSERTTLGDLFGHLFEEYRQGGAEAPEAAAPEPEPAAATAAAAEPAGTLREAAETAAPGEARAAKPPLGQAAMEATSDHSMADLPAPAPRRRTRKPRPEPAEEGALAAAASTDSSNS